MLDHKSASSGTIYKTGYIKGKKVFLPLVQTSIVILPLLFKLCDFTPVILKRTSRLPLVCTAVSFARFKWEEKNEKEKTHMGKDSSTLTLSFPTRRAFPSRRSREPVGA